MAGARTQGRQIGADDGAIQMLEARKDPRVALDLPVGILSSDFPVPLPGITRDVGTAGVCVATRSMFALGSVHSVILDLPQGQLRFPAEARWQADSDCEDSFLTGLAFEDPEPAAVDALARVVDTAGEELARFIHEASVLRGLATDEAMGIAQISRLRIVPSYRGIYQQEKRTAGGDSLFILRSGAVTLHYRITPTSEVTSARLAPGAVFGGLPMFADVPNLESATVCEKSVLIEVTRGAYSHLRLSRPLLAHRLNEVAIRCHVDHVRRLLDLAARRR